VRKKMMEKKTVATPLAGDLFKVEVAGLHVVLTLEEMKKATSAMEAALTFHSMEGSPGGEDSDPPRDPDPWTWDKIDAREVRAILERGVSLYNEEDSQ
jgi:hypothetical protein